MTTTTDQKDKPKGATDTTSVAQGRFTVAIPAEVATQIDQVGHNLAEAVRKQTGVGVELSRAQIVTALVKSALAAQAEAAAKDE